MDGGSGDVVGASLCLRFLSDVKTLVSVSEADIRIVALADVTVVQGMWRRRDDVLHGQRIRNRTVSRCSQLNRDSSRNDSQPKNSALLENGGPFRRGRFPPLPTNATSTTPS